MLLFVSQRDAVFIHGKTVAYTVNLLPLDTFIANLFLCSVRPHLAAINHTLTTSHANLVTLPYAPVLIKKKKK